MRKEKAKQEDMEQLKERRKLGENCDVRILLPGKMEDDRWRGYSCRRILMEIELLDV